MCCCFFDLGSFGLRKDIDLSPYGMYRSYFKIGWRNLAKNKGYSVINIAGLAIGLACCLSIGLYIQDEYSYDRFHKNGANIYRVVQHQTKQGAVYDLPRLLDHWQERSEKILLRL